MSARCGVTWVEVDHLGRERKRQRQFKSESDLAEAVRELSGQNLRFEAWTEGESTDDRFCFGCQSKAEHKCRKRRVWGYLCRCRRKACRERQGRG